MNATCKKCGESVTFTPRRGFRLGDWRHWHMDASKRARGAYAGCDGEMKETTKEKR